MDSEKACYKVAQPLVAVMSQAQSALRTSIGKNDLDHLLKDRHNINLSVREALNNSVEQWGVDVSRFEITDLTPDKKIQEAMDLQSTAERERRAVVTTAEGRKKAMELEAEGKRRSWELDAEGRKYATELTAHADKIKVELDAQGTKNAAALIANIDPAILEYTVRMAHINMMQRLATEGKHSTYFVPKDMSALPAWADLFSNKKTQ
jgi:regulator of protease activity HflC (stomatin/prohibitin superfamily)